MRATVLAPLLAALLPQTALAESQDPTEPFTLSLPSGLDIQAQQVGLQFYDPGNFGRTTPVYQMNARFRAKDYEAQDAVYLHEHYGLDTTPDGDFDPLAVPAMVQDTEWICDLTKTQVREAIQHIPELPEELLSVIEATPPTFYSILIEMKPMTEEDAERPHVFSILHDLEGSSCKAIPTEVSGS